MPSRPTLLILGGSARAAAGSAIRAGYSPWCVDLFADADLRQMASAIRCSFTCYPTGLVEILRAAPDAPWIYTGAMENYPLLISELSEIRPLIGNGPASIRPARSPFFVSQILREAGLPTPEVRRNLLGDPRHCRWLRKPFASAAGNGIAFADTRNAERSNRHYFQQFMDGQSMSAVFVRHDSKAILLGVTEQLVGVDWLNARPFHYSGNIGPVSISARLNRDLQLAGHVLGERCNLLGLFGVDFILHDDRPWIVEVNPRYTASVEVLEIATGLKSLSSDLCSIPPPQKVVGKAIWYAPCRLVMPSYQMDTSTIGARILIANQTEIVNCADIPSPGEVIESGWPVMTLFASGSTREDCVERLRESAAVLSSLLCQD